MTTQRQWRDTTVQPQGEGPDGSGVDDGRSARAFFEPAPPVPLPRRFRTVVPEPDDTPAADDRALAPLRQSMPSLAAIPLSIAIGITAAALWRGWQDDRRFHARYAQTEAIRQDPPFSATGAWRALPPSDAAGLAVAAISTATNRPEPAPPAPFTPVQVIDMEPPFGPAARVASTGPERPEPVAKAAPAPAPIAASTPVAAAPQYLATAMAGAQALPMPTHGTSSKPRKANLADERPAPAKAKATSKVAAAKRGVAQPSAQARSKAPSQYEFLEPSGNRRIDQIGRDAP